MRKIDCIKKFSILIVDDIKSNLLALNALLVRDDVEIHQARSGNEALELMLKHNFCLALLDVQMPEMNGFELAELMRGSNKTKNIPIIFITANANNQKFEFRGYESGGVDFLIKPVDPLILKSKVNVFLELQGQRHELENQVNGLNAAREQQEELLAKLTKSNEKLVQAVRDREDFMTIAGHEFKTPLTALVLQSQMRSRNLGKGKGELFTSEKLEEMFVSDNKHFERLTRLTNDMLDVSRFNSGNLSMNLEVFDISLLIKEIIERNVGVSSTAGCLLEIVSPLAIYGSWDKLRIEQIMTNLISNAIKYGAGQPIKVNVNSLNNHVIITVSDKGMGIAVENLKRIFLRYERASGVETVSGLGLGLYIVKQIVEAHGGVISVKSQLGIGSEFTVDLPMSV